MTAVPTVSSQLFSLSAATAADLMTPNPLSLREDATLKEAIAFLVDRGISGAPVIDEAGRPVGVLTQSDILIHNREEVARGEAARAEHGEPLPRSWWDEARLGRPETTPVCDLMTPAVFSAHRDTPVAGVVVQLRELNVHRLFVVDEHGALVGVITAMDIVRRLTVAEHQG